MSYERRQFYRIRFPIEERPALLIDDRRLRVSELSEGGMRVLGGEVLKGTITGRLAFNDGKTLPVAGRVERRSNGVTVVRDLQGISFADMMDEQRRLVRMYPFL